MKIFDRFKKKDEILDKDYVCKNCGTKFYGQFCPHCSQSIKEFEQPIGFMVVDFVGNMFAFDTRFWKTFKAVLYKPGHMANSFVEGHRVRYMPPFRFYIFISFIFFLLLNISVNSSFKDQDFFNISNNNTSLNDSVFISKANALFKENIEKNNVDSIVKAQLSQEIGDAKADSIIKSIKHKLIDNQIKNNLDNITNNSKIDLSEDKDESIAKDKIRRIYDDFKAHPDYFTTKALKYISWSLFFFMPFFAFLMWLFFRKSHRYYVIHLIFAINQHAFLFIIFSILIVTKTYLPDLIGNQSPYLLLTLPVYHIIGAKQLYKQKTVKTIFKLIASGFLYWFTLIVGITLLVVWSVIN